MDISVNDDVIDFNGNTVAELLEQLVVMFYFENPV